MVELTDSLSEVEIAPGRWNEFVAYVKKTGVRFPKKPLVERKAQRTYDVNSVISLMNPISAAIIGINSMHSTGEVGDQKFNNDVRKANYRAEQVRQQIQRFLQPKSPGGEVGK